MTQIADSPILAACRALQSTVKASGQRCIGLMNLHLEQPGEFTARCGLSAHARLAVDVA